MSTLSELIDLVELDLRDTSNANWSVAELTQHVRRALRALNEVTPGRTASTLSVAAGSREVSLAGLSGLMRVIDVWYPYTAADPEYPPQRPRWELIADEGGQNRILYLYVEDKPAEGEALRVFYTLGHTIEGLDGATATTLSERQEHVVVLGATALAVQQYAQDAIGEVSPSGWTPRQLQEWADRRLTLFRQALEDLRRSEIIMQDPRVPWEADRRSEGAGGVI
ncbi:MAG: hypothetical protein H5T69_16385 [Chloroflexi bacterium]|nr:hypothetical protein [Chloroflexota bacterium]